MHSFDSMSLNNAAHISSFSNTSNKQPQTVDVISARAAYLNATEHAKERHAEIGILRPKGDTLEVRLGKDEPYGAHRVGSVTKTFTTFLALKLSNTPIKLENGTTFGLDTKCGELIDANTLKTVFADPDTASQMTLAQLLSHTSGLEYDDHNRDGGGANCTTMDERFRCEGEIGTKYKHTSKPGDCIGSYSNAGLAVASWMMEIAYNQKDGNREIRIPFSEIMKKEIFNEVFQLSEDSFIAPGPTGDIIASAAGDMTSSVKDLLKVAASLQEGENHLATHFGSGWHQKMLASRDLFEHHGLGCSAKESSIQHAGLNSEKFENGNRDVTALVIFPLKKEDPGLVAMCDSNALGPLPSQGVFANELRKLAGMEVQVQQDPEYSLDFFCPASETSCVFKGDAYVITDVDPFAEKAPEKIICSRNGMKHELTREPKFDAKDAIAYQDTNGKKWMVISKEEGKRKILYSEYCLVSPSSKAHDLSQPSLEKLKAIEGVYYDAGDDLTYHFMERGGNLYFREGNDKTYPALYLPEENFWVVSLPAGRKNIKFRFSDDPDQKPLTIVDISKQVSSSIAEISDAVPPFNSVRVKQVPEQTTVFAIQTSEARPQTAAEGQFLKWLNAFNNCDVDTKALEQFANEFKEPQENAVQGALGLFERVQGFTVVNTLQSSRAEIQVVLQEQCAFQEYALLTLSVEEDFPHRILNMKLAPHDVEHVPAGRMTEVEAVKAVDSEIDRLATEGKFSGTVRVTKIGNPTPLISRTVGMADNEQGKEVGLETKFNLGSMNKMFTTVAILGLIEEGNGKISIDDPIGKYLSSHIDAESALAKVTIRQLLTHTGGTGSIEGPDFAEAKEPKDYMTLLKGRELLFEPGSRWEYSNYGFVLLGAIIEEISQKSYYDCIRERVYEKAGMTDSDSYFKTETVPNMATGYIRKKDGLHNNIDSLPQRGTPAGGGYSTVLDLEKFANALVEKKLVNEASLAQLSTRREVSPGSNYAIGFQDGDFWYGHAGRCDGVNSELRIYPGAGYVVAVMANLDPPAASNLAEFIGDRLPVVPDDQ